MDVDWKTYALPERVDSIADSGLHAFLLAHPQAPVRLSAATLRRLDMQLVEYLIAVARDWATRETGFVLCDLAPPQAKILTLIGVTPALLPWQEAGA